MYYICKYNYCLGVIHFENFNEEEEENVVQHLRDFRTHIESNLTDFTKNFLSK